MSTFQMVPVAERPPSSTPMHVSAAYSTVLYIKVLIILFFNSNFIFPLSNSHRLLDIFSNGYSMFHFLVAFAMFCDYIVYWRRSIVVRMLVSASELYLSCARLLAGRVTILWLSRPLSVSQRGQLSHPSLRGR